MAIKKGAFDLYTAERQLPNKQSNKFSHKNHMFDEPQNSHTNNTIKSETPFGEQKNGSQTVHKRFTTETIENNNNQEDTKKNDTTYNKKIGSQSVHNRFTTETIENNNNQDDTKKNYAIHDKKIGSQSVHNRFTNYKESIVNGKLSNQDNSDLSTCHASQESQNKTLEFSKLVGNQREIVLAIYKNIKMHGDKTTEELTLESIAELANVNIKSLKNTLFRLNSIGVILRSEQKIGRGGWVKYSLPPSIIDDINKSKKNQKRKVQ